MARLIIAITCVVVVLILVRHASSLDVDLENTITPVPVGPGWILSAAWALGSVGAMVVMVLLALVSKRPRMARDGVVAALVSGLFCAGLVAWIGPMGGRPAGLNLGGVNPALPLARLSISLAVALAIVPYLTRWLRRTLLTAIALGAVAAVLQQHGFAFDVIGSLAIGWAAAAGMHVALESPTGLPSKSDVLAAAGDLGLELTDIEIVRPQPWGVARFSAKADGDPVDVSIYGRDADDAQMLNKLARFFWYRDSGPALRLTRLQEVEHTAYLTLSAEKAKANVPDVVVAAMSATGSAAVLVTKPPAWQPLSAIDESVIDDAALDALYGQIKLLRDADIAHGAISSSTLTLTVNGRAGVQDFRSACSSASQERLDHDLAGTLVVLALLVGSQRSVDAAVRILGKDAVARALPRVQAATLDPVTRRQMASHKAQKQLLDEVRQVGATAVGVDNTKLTELHRVSLSGLLMAAGAFLGVYLVARELAGAGDIWATIQTADLGWALAAFLVAQSTNLAQAWAVIGSVSSPLAFGPTLGLELTNAYTGLVAGTVGTTTTTIRYFQKQGLTVSIAVSSGVLVTLATMVTQVALFVVAFLASRSSFQLNTSSTQSGSDGGSSTWWILVIALIVISAIGLVTLIPRFRRKIMAKVKPQISLAVENLRGLLKQPGHLVRLIGGTLGSQLLFAITLGCALHAFGASLPLGALVVINTLASLIGGIAPVPGGLGVIEGGLIAGLTAAGIDSATATAATLTARLFTAYLPPLWGYPTMVWMRKQDYL